MEIKGAAKSNKNSWKISTYILAFAFVSLMIFSFGFNGKITGRAVSADSASESLLAYLNTLADSEVSLVGVEDKDSFYIVTVKYQGQELPVYMTKDGKYYTTFLAPIENSENTNGKQNQGQQEIEVPKSDKPKVELFVMTYCPYGTQAEKGLIPVLETLGDSVDSKIRFVHYFMHGDKEEQETYTQVCIREEQNAKYLDYLKCFLEDGDSERCLDKVGIDKTKLSSCLSSNAKNYYAEDSKLSKDYGVQGSPTLVINGVIVGSARDSASFLDTVCKSFNSESVPETCSSKLSSQTPSPGFGYGEGTSSAGAC